MLFFFSGKLLSSVPSCSSDLTDKGPSIVQYCFVQVRALASRLSVAESALQQAVLDDFKLLLGTVDVKVCLCLVVCRCVSII